MGKGGLSVDSRQSCRGLWACFGGEVLCSLRVFCYAEGGSVWAFFFTRPRLGDRPMVDAAVPFQRGWGNDFPLQ